MYKIHVAKFKYLSLAINCKITLEQYLDTFSTLSLKQQEAKDPTMLGYLSTICSVAFSKSSFIKHRSLILSEKSSPGEAEKSSHSVCDDPNNWRTKLASSFVVLVEHNSDWKVKIWFKYLKSVQNLYKLNSIFNYFNLFMLRPWVS